MTIEERGIVVGLVGYMCERWATDKLTAEEGAKVVLRPGVLAEITGREKPSYGLARLRQALGKTSARVWQEGGNAVVEWPKVATMQRFDRLSAPQSSSASASASAVPPIAPRAPVETKPPPKPEKIHCPSLAQWSAAQRAGVSRDFTDPQIDWAIEIVRAWHEDEAASSKARQLRTFPRGWAQCVRNAMTRGWGLEGFRANGSPLGGDNPTTVVEGMIRKMRAKTEGELFDAARKVN